MTMEELKNRIPDFGKDIRLNLDGVLSTEGSVGLTHKQIWGVALASAYAIESAQVVSAVLQMGADQLDDATVEAAKGAATIMGMNNVYYRGLHLMEDGDLKKLPARLRMNIIGKPGIEKVDFELMCFAVSAIGACGQCLTAHLRELRHAGVTNEGIQSTLKIASVLNAAARAVRIAEF